MSERARRIAVELAAAAAGTLTCAAAVAQPSAVVALRSEQEIECPVTGARRDRACAQMLLQIVRARAQEEFIVRHQLRATDSELAELEAYDRAFKTHDRSQRARKLTELDERLAVATDPAEVARLHEFRAVLARLARYEADIDAGVEEKPTLSPDVLRRWIEGWKLDVALYAKYAGTVGLTSAGPYAHGAKAALVVEYMRIHPVDFADKAIERHFREALVAPPRFLFTGETPDFTPFWKRPIPPSYVVD